MITARGIAPGDAARSGIVLRPAADGRLDAEDTLHVLDAHAVPGAEVHERSAARHTRLLTLTDGHTHRVTVHIDAQEVTVDTDAAEPAHPEITARVRAWLDLDVDLAPIIAALGRDPTLAPLVRAHPWLRVMHWPETFEGIIATIVGQQVSLAAARSLSGLIVARHGSPHPSGLRAFPHAGALAACDPDEFARDIGMPRSRGRAIVAAARAFRDDERLRRPTEPDAFRAALLDIPGVGPWTADYLTVRSSGAVDGFVPGDLVARRALGGISAAEVARRAEAWRPHRAYALVQLWAAGTAR